jgi:hypothetical protein
VFRQYVAVNMPNEYVRVNMEQQLRIEVTKLKENPLQYRILSTKITQFSVLTLFRSFILKFTQHFVLNTSIPLFS